MLLPLILDVLLLLAIVGAVARGASQGLLSTAGSTLGAIAGAIAAYLLLPLVTQWVPLPEWRTPAVFLALIILIGGGLTVGERIGNAGRRAVPKKARPLDRLGGALAGGVVALLVMSLMGSTVTALGIPIASPTTASSTVLRTIDRFTPVPVARALGQVRGLVVAEGIPRIADAFGGGAPPPPPVVDAATPALQAAATRVGRVTGAAYACGQVQSGTAFVIGEDRLMTNAHVVQGVTEPTVELPGIGGRAGRVVYFDAQQDVAVIAVDGLGIEPLGLTGTQPAGTVGAVQGYPFGGPFVSAGAEVVDAGTILADDITGGSRAPRETYTLAADVNPGNSGGPVLTLDGAVMGMVFARSESTDDVGYAHTMAELDPVIAEAGALSAPVATGNCQG